MALDTQENLIKTVINYSHRGDLGTKMNDFILLAETEMLSNPISQLELNTGEKISTAQTSTSDRFLALPEGFMSSRKFSITIDERVGQLTFRTPSQLNIRQGTGIPCFYTIRGDEIEFDILPEKEYTVTLTYFYEFTPLSDDNQTNYVLTKYPNIYLFGCLSQVFTYTQDTEEEAKYKALFLSAIKSANKSEKKARYIGQPEITVGWAP